MARPEGFGRGSRLNANEIHARLRARFGDTIGDLAGTRPDNVCATVAPAAIAEVSRFAKDDPELAFDCLSNLSGVDYPKRAVIEIVYNLYSYRHRHLFTLKVGAPRDNPVVPTVSGVWAHADTLEACRDELEDVLEEWLVLSLAKNLPIPTIDGIDLSVSRAPTSCSPEHPARLTGAT